MKNILLGTVAVISLTASSSVFAADLAARPYTKAPPFVAASPIYNWTGFYIGGHIGGDFVGTNVFNGNSNGRFIGGVQGGADYQFSPNWVIGVEANYSFKTNNSGNGYVFADPAGAGLFTTNANNRGIGSATGRLGYAVGPALFYVKGGYAFRNSNDAAVTVGGVPVAFTYNRSKDGYTVGGGLEYLFTQNWSGKIEYQYYNFGNRQFVVGPVALVGLGSFRSDEHTIKAGINYRFNLGGPVVARY